MNPELQRSCRLPEQRRRFLTLFFPSSRTFFPDFWTKSGVKRYLNFNQHTPNCVWQLVILSFIGMAWMLRIIMSAQGAVFGAGFEVWINLGCIEM